MGLTEGKLVPLAKQYKVLNFSYPVLVVQALCLGHCQEKKLRVSSLWNVIQIQYNFLSPYNKNRRGSKHFEHVYLIK